MRKMLFYPRHQLRADVRIVNGIDQHFRLFGPGRLQQIDPGGIAVENLHIKFAQGIDMVRVMIEDHHLHPAREQQSPGNLPEAAKAGDNHPRLLFINLVSITRGRWTISPDGSAAPAEWGLPPSTGPPPWSTLLPIRRPVHPPSARRQTPQTRTHSPAPAAPQTSGAGRAVRQAAAISHSISIFYRRGNRPAKSQYAADG